MNRKYIQINIFFTLSLYALSSAMEPNTQLTDEQYIKKHCLNWTNKKITSLNRIDCDRGGSRIYEVNFDQGNPCVVRLLISCYAKEKAWQETEIAVMKSAHQAGVGPQVFAAQEKDENHEIGYIVMQNINELPLQNVPWNNATTYTNLGELLQKMHNQPSVVPVDENAIYRRMNFIVNDLQKKWHDTNYKGLSKQCNKIATFFKESQKILTPHGRTQLVHGDLIIGNLLHDGSRFWAIDWEHSRMTANPLYDVALVYNCFVPDEYHADFMQGYCGNNDLPAEKQETFKTMRILSSCLIGMTCARLNLEEFASQYRKHKASQTNATHVLQNMIHGGFKAETKEDVVTFGTLLFMQGYKGLKG